MVAVRVLLAGDALAVMLLRLQKLGENQGDDLESGVGGLGFVLGHAADVTELRLHCPSPCVQRFF